jgi:hypothetical protein
MTKRLAVTLQPGEKYRDPQHGVVTILDGQEPLKRAGRAGSNTGPNARDGGAT